MFDLSRKKLTVITNVVLLIIFSVVFSLGFMPEESVFIYGGERISAIYNGNRNSNKISIMINVYENDKIVYSMLDLFDEYNAKVTFFVGGCWADDNEKLLKDIVKRGHEIGNHGYFHKDHKTLSYEKNVEEISLTETIVKSLCDVRPKLFAPPSGSFSDTTLKAATDLGYTVIMWSKDTIDWRDRDVNKIIDRATKNIKGGDFVLIHPKEQTLLALPEILDYYISKGYELVSVSSNL